MSKDFGLENHKAWLGLLQPVGLVVSPYALVQAQAAIDVNASEHQLVFKKLLTNHDSRVLLPFGSFSRFFTDVLGWRETDLQTLGKDSEAGSIFLKEYQEIIAATHAVYGSKNDLAPMLLIQFLESETGFDEIASDGWQTSIQTKFERLLREKSIPIGLLLNPSGIRLVYAPRGESSGYVTFPFSLMSEVSGRVVLGALQMLLGSDRLFTLDPKERLPTLLVESRKYQNVVSTMLSEQVLAALYELLRGLQAANDHTAGKLLGEILKNDKDQIYHGLLTVLLRNVFILFAEDRDLIPPHPIYVANYSIKGLFERLRADEAKFADTMDQRYGAWSQLIALYRIIYEGIEFPGFTLPARKGHLFDPERFPFLEGRKKAEDSTEPPLLSDGTIFRVLKNLIMLDGERISYRTLDVEQIGSVYETVMGFRLEVVDGPSIAIKPKKAQGAPVVINLNAVLSKTPKDRSKFVKELTEQDIKSELLSEVTSIEALEAALDKKISRLATPTVVPAGSMVLQPSDERRRSGSHYTPRNLTEPIVRRALEPIRIRLRDEASPDQILKLKICDPAMGSGAFLVEATRQLAEWLVLSWRFHKLNIPIPPDEDELLYAKRIVAQRCIYGVDKNPMAVDLAKLSLWLATFARDHAFTFLDHSLKCGDSLIGLSLKQISCGNWEETDQIGIFSRQVQKAATEYLELRHEIALATEDREYDVLALLNDEAQERVAELRLAGDLIIKTFFSGRSDRTRKEHLSKVQELLIHLFDEEATAPNISLTETARYFHWELEFPEVFSGSDAGFDCFVGNPPFLGGKRTRGVLGDEYGDWLIRQFKGAGKNADLSAFFFRRCFQLLNSFGSAGLIATNTIAQGDTRAAGLRVIIQDGGAIYFAQKRLQWPGLAAVVVSVVHFLKNRNKANMQPVLNGRSVQEITAFLFHQGPSDDPERLSENDGKSFIGSVLLGMGFTFDDTGKDGQTWPKAKMEELIAKDSANSQVIFPYIGGEEVNSKSDQANHRFTINFGERELEEASRWPDVLDLVREKVKTERDLLSGTNDAEKYKANWWKFGRSTPGLYQAIRGLSRVIAINAGATPHVAFTFLPSNMVYANTLCIFAFERFYEFSILQSRVHELWAYFMGSSMKDDLRYTPRDCFETFPFPRANQSISSRLEEVGRQYFESRALTMRQSGLGMTKTYNRLHDPEETGDDIVLLRKLHAQMDRAVLDSYGWSDISVECDFLLDYEEDPADESARTSKKPWRYRWPDAVRDDVLARLLSLNAARATEQKIVGSSTKENRRKGSVQ